MELLNCYLPFKSTVLRTRHSHNFKLVPYQPRIDAYKYSFLPRTVQEWNRLDDEIIETDCVEEFKQKLAPSMYIVIIIIIIIINFVNDRVLSTHRWSGQKRSGRTIYAVINGPAGPFVHA